MGYGTHRGAALAQSGSWGRKGVLGTHSVVDSARVGEAGMGRRACLVGVLRVAQLWAEELELLRAMRPSSRASL